MTHPAFWRCLCRLYGWALYAYPPDFRRRFGAEMLQVFRDRGRCAAQTRGLAGLLFFGLESAADWMLTGIREGIAAMTRPAFGGSAAQPANDVPAFYLCDQSLPRTGALIDGAVLAAACLAGVCLLIAHGGGFPSILIGSPEHRRSSLISAPTTAPPAPLSTEVRVRPEPAEPPLPFYFRLLSIVSTLDANQDGVISSNEITNAPAVLAKLDRNHDGQLDADECGGNFVDDSHAAAPSAAALTTTLMAFDRNHDGKLTRSELPERLQGLFDRGDTAHSGVLSRPDIEKLAASETARAPHALSPEFLARARLAFMHIHPILAALDADRDGIISASEIRHGAPRLRTLDENRDGKLTVDEILPDPVGAATAQFVSIFDTNSDGVLSPSEWSAVAGKNLRQALTRASRNHDGKVTEEELLRQLGNLATYDEMRAASRTGFAALSGLGSK